MTDDQDHRQYIRIEKHVTMQFCIADAFPQKWDMSFVDNISVGGVRFTASSDLELNEKKILLHIKIPQLSPRSLDLEATVLSATPCLNGKTSEIRAKFINLSKTEKEGLSILEMIINQQLNKNDPKENDGKA